MALGAALFWNPVYDLVLLIMLPMAAGLVGVIVFKYLQYRFPAGSSAEPGAPWIFPRGHKAQVAELERLFRLEAEAHASGYPTLAGSESEPSAKNIGRPAR